VDVMDWGNPPLALQHCKWAGSEGELYGLTARFIGVLVFDGLRRGPAWSEPDSGLGQAA